MRITGRIISLLALALLVAPYASAHRLLPNDGTHVDADSALAIAEPDVSQLVLHEVTKANPELWLTFQGTVNEDIYLQLGVPAIDRLADYHPSLALVGPGLPDVELPFAIPEGAGAIALSTEEIESQFFSEPFTGTESWIYVEKTLTLPEDGEYFIVGYHPDSTAGKLWLAFGTEEAFGLQDVFDYADTLEKVRAFHEVSEMPLGIIPRLFLLLSALLRLFARFLPLGN